MAASINGGGRALENPEVLAVDFRFLLRKCTASETPLQRNGSGSEILAEDDFRMMKEEEENSGVLKTMVIFSLAMLFFPVFLYFFSKGVFFEAFLGMSSQDSYFYAAFVAIGTIHIILGLFVYAAFTEGTSTSVKKD